MNPRFKISLIALNTKLGSQERTAAQIAGKFNVDAEKITKNGITKLYSLSEQEDLVNFTSQVGIELLHKSEIDLLKIKGIFGSNNLTARLLMPSFTACVANRLGLRNICCDHVGLGCSGGLQALKIAYNQAVIDYLVGEIGYYLVVVGDQINRIVDPKDYGTSVLFSDGVAAVCITNNPDEERGYKIERVATKSLLSDDIYSLRLKNPHYGLDKLGGLPKLKMDGPKIFQFASNSFLDMLKLAKLKAIDDETYFIPHQANLRIIEALIKKYRLNSNDIYVDGVKTIGNTLNASIFFGLKDASSRNLFPKRNHVLLGAFGAELQIGVALLVPQKHDLVLC